MPRILTLVDAQAAGLITHIRGHDSNIGMTIEVQNDSDEPITIMSEVGTVIGSKDPRKQKMVIIRERSWTVPPRSRHDITVDALCLEAYKVPPSSNAAAADHSVDGMTDDADIRRLLKTLQEIEAKFSASFVPGDTKAHTLESPRLVELASAASRERVKGQNKFISQILNFVVQMPVWQITDRIEMTDYAKVVGRDKPETLEELRETVDGFASTAKMAEILLSEAELSHKQTITVPEGELEILYVEHKILSSGIASLRLEAITPGAEKEAVQIELSEKEALLNGLEREIGIYPHKATLIKELSRLPITATLGGRTSLLDGMRADSLRRDEGMQRHDLDLIVTQLARLGRDEHGDILLVKLMENALGYASGYEAHANLTNLMNEFTSF